MKTDVEVTLSHLKYILTKVDVNGKCVTLVKHYRTVNLINLRLKSSIKNN